jgi:hypothetical protein
MKKPRDTELGVARFSQTSLSYPYYTANWLRLQACIYSWYGFSTLWRLS